jgi:hypothetical protein
MTIIPPLRSEYYVLPKDDPLRAVNMLRAAAGLAPNLRPQRRVVPIRPPSRIPRIRLMAALGAPQRS